jgi:membrane protein DedA with SNARE-associated domain
MSQMSEFLVSHTGPVLFLTILAEQIGLPLPAAPLLVAVGGLAADGALSASSAIAISTAAYVLADLIWFFAGRRGGSNLLRFVSKFFLSDGSIFERTERLFARHGMWAVAAAKFVPVLGFLIPPLAGAFRVGPGRFLWFDFLGSAVYGIFYLTIGFLFSTEVTGFLESISHLGLGTAAVASAAIIIFVAYKYAHRQNAAKPEGENRAVALSLQTR